MLNISIIGFDFDSVAFCERSRPVICMTSNACLEWKCFMQDEYKDADVTMSLQCYNIVRNGWKGRKSATIFMYRMDLEISCIFRSFYSFYSFLFRLFVSFVTWDKWFSRGWPWMTSERTDLIPSLMVSWTPYVLSSPTDTSPPWSVAGVLPEDDDDGMILNIIYFLL